MTDQPPTKSQEVEPTPKEASPKRASRGEPELREVLYEVDRGIAVITLNRPEVFNAATTGMLRELVECLDRVDHDDEVRVAVVTGAGRAFCAGADLSGGGEAFSFPADHRDSAGEVSLRLLRCTKPVIAAVNGHAVGFGASLILPMDFRIVAAEAKLGYVFAARGIVPDGAASWFLAKVVGLPRALDWCLTGRIFGPEEALEAGLAREVRPRGEVLPAALELAAQIRDQVAPLSAALTRQLLWQSAGADDPLEAHLVESAGIALTGNGDDAREGVTSFREKRAPRWRQSVPADLPDWYPWAERQRPEPARD